MKTTKLIAKTQRVDVRRTAADTMRAVERFSRARIELAAASWELANHYDVLMPAVAGLFCKAVPPEDVIDVVKALFAAHRTLGEKARDDAAIFRDGCCNANAMPRSR